jgi:hypothetical protein
MKGIVSLFVGTAILLFASDLPGQEYQSYSLAPGADELAFGGRSGGRSGGGLFSGRRQSRMGNQYGGPQMGGPCGGGQPGMMGGPCGGGQPGMMGGPCGGGGQPGMMPMPAAPMPMPAAPMPLPVAPVADTCLPVPPAIDIMDLPDPEPRVIECEVTCNLPEELSTELVAIKTLAEVNSSKLDQLLERPQTDAGIAEELAEINIKLDGPLNVNTDVETREALNSLIVVVNELTAKVGELAAKEPGEVNLTVDTPNFLPPDYVDLSLIWAQQKASGISHAVLVTDTQSASWAQVNQTFIAAKQKFSPLSVFDVRSKNVVVKKLPQLVIYPKEGAPQVISEPDEVFAELGKLAHLP